MTFQVTKRPITNEAQRLLINGKVSLGRIAAVAGCSKAAAGYWMQGEKRPGQESRAAIEAEWPEVRATLWDTLPTPTDVSNDDEPEVDTSPEADGDPTYESRMLAHLTDVERQIADARKERRVGDWTRLGTLKQRILNDLAKFKGELSATDEARLVKTKRFVEIRSAIAKTLVHYPEAGKAVEEALRAIRA